MTDPRQPPTLRARLISILAAMPDGASPETITDRILAACADGASPGWVSFEDRGAPDHTGPLAVLTLSPAGSLWEADIDAGGCLTLRAARCDGDISPTGVYVGLVDLFLAQLLGLERTRARYASREALPPCTHRRTRRPPTPEPAS